MAADDNYAQHLGVALISIIENYQDSRLLVFHIFDNNISAHNKEYLEIIGGNKNVTLIFYKITPGLLNDCPEVNHLTKTCYARLLVAELLPPGINKVIYLDADIVVSGDVSELYDQDLGDFPLGAVADVMSREILRIYFYPGLFNYFNSGVLLINLDLWRREAIKQKAWEFIRCYSSDIIRADQDVLNCLFKNNWKLLDNRFNTDLKRKGFLAKPVSNVIILHYSDRIKPWHYLFVGLSGCHYFTYLKKTPWKDFKFKDKNLKNFIKKYFLLFVKETKKILLPYLPAAFLDSYRRLLWRTYKIKK